MALTLMTLAVLAASVLGAPSVEATPSFQGTDEGDGDDETGDGGSGPASSPMTAHLCSANSVPCSVRLADEVREGAAEHVHVTGRPSATVEVQVFKLDVVGHRIEGMEPLGEPVAVTLEGHGHGSALLPVAPLTTGDNGGWVLVTLADATWDGGPGPIVGQIVPLGARAPTLLGDGYGTQKPVGTTLEMEVTNHIAGTEFQVQYLGDDGNWHDTTIEAVEREDRQPVVVLRYAVPNGLLPKPYRFRAHNVTDPSAVDQEWVVEPSTNPLPQDRAPILDPPELGTDVTTSLQVAAASSHRVIVGTSVLGAFAVAAVVAWPALAIRRRRVEPEPR